jgi:thiamine biosynthesis protein ThiI
MSIYLLKIGELTLKGDNRKTFERTLKRNIAFLLKGSGAVVESTHGRFFVRCPAEADLRVEDALSHLYGIAGWAKALVCEKTVEAVIAACIEEARTLAARGTKTFKIEARRTDKSFPLGSYDIMYKAGEAVLNAVAGLRVDVHHPQEVIAVEIREKAYVYAAAHAGPWGLPVGTAGKGLLLLSGGIDSPVAGCMMAARGLRIDAVYFHAYPYTSEEARQKVITLANIMSRYCMKIHLYTVSFTSIEERIKERAPTPWLTVLLRMAMMDCAERMARSNHAGCLITGESLSQVASQTLENITCAESKVTLPVFRPLIGMDKERIIRTAEAIGTYETSILPYEDCCVLFSPPHPILRGDAIEARRRYEELDLDALITLSINESVMQKCG